MKQEGIYFVQWTEDFEYDEFSYKVYAKGGVFLGGYRTPDEAEEVATYGRIHGYCGQC